MGATDSGARGEARPALSPFLSLRSRDYRYLWAGTFFISGGQWVQQVTIGWLVWSLSGSPFLVGLVSGLRTIPFLVVSPLAGVWADRYDRKRLLIGVDLAIALTALLFAGVVGLGWVRVWHTALYMVVQGSLWATLGPIRQALLANTVPRSSLPNAVALQSLAFNLTRSLGPALGGALMAVLGAAVNFLLQGLAFLTAGLLALPLGTPYREEGGHRPLSLVQGMREGARYLWRDRPLLALVASAFVEALFIMGTVHLLPVFTARALGKGPETLGLLMGAVGIGALAGAFLMALLGPGRRAVLPPAFLTLSTGALLVLSQARGVALALALALLMGLGQMAFRIANTSVIQGRVPDDLRGRVMSLYLMEFGFVFAGSLLWGTVAQYLGVRGGLGVAGGLGLSLALAFLLRFRPLWAVR